MRKGPSSITRGLPLLSHVCGSSSSAYVWEGNSFLAWKACPLQGWRQAGSPREQVSVVCPSWPGLPTRACRDAPEKTLIPFWVVNGAPSCPPGQVWPVRCPRQPHVLGRRPCWWGWGWGSRHYVLWVLELSFIWQQFVIDMHLRQENKAKQKTNGLLLPLCSFILEMFPSAPVRCSGKKFHINKLLLSPALLINSFPVSPPPPTKPWLYGAGRQFRTWEEGSASKYLISFMILMVLLWLLSFPTLVATMLLSPDHVYGIWKFLSKSK